MHILFFKENNKMDVDNISQKKLKIEKLAKVSLSHFFQGLFSDMNL